MNEQKIYFKDGWAAIHRRDLVFDRAGSDVDDAGIAFIIDEFHVRSHIYQELDDGDALLLAGDRQGRPAGPILHLQEELHPTTAAQKLLLHCQMVDKQFGNLVKEKKKIT